MNFEAKHNSYLILKHLSLYPFLSKCNIASKLVGHTDFYFEIKGQIID